MLGGRRRRSERGIRAGEVGGKSIWSGERGGGVEEEEEEEEEGSREKGKGKRGKAGRPDGER